MPANCSSHAAATAKQVPMPDFVRAWPLPVPTPSSPSDHRRGGYSAVIGAMRAALEG